MTKEIQLSAAAESWLAVSAHKKGTTLRKYAHSLRLNLSGANHLWLLN